MENKIVSKFKSNPTDYYGMSIAASWAGVGSLMNSITMTHTYGLIPSMIWGFGNSIACIVFGIIACRLTTFRDLMRTKVMQYIIGVISVFQLWLNMNGIREIYDGTYIGTKGGTVIVYTVCILFILLLLKFGMIRNVLTDTWSWFAVMGIVFCLTVAAMCTTPDSAVTAPRLGLEWENMKVGLWKGFLLVPGPFTFPYFYKILDYNDSNDDETKKIDVRKSFTLGGILFGAYMLFTYVLAIVQFSPLLMFVKAVLISLIGISTISTFLYSEYIVFGRNLGLAINVVAVFFWPLFISMGVMGVWTLMASIRVYLVAGMLAIALIKSAVQRKEAAV